jgi:large subunit ribosomal protein L10
MNRDEKAAAIKEISSSLKDAGSVFAFDYRGISVAQGAELRTQLREADTTFKVVKNRLAKLALADGDTGELEELLKGPTAIAFVGGDPVTAAKALFTFARDHDGVPAYKGGLMDGAALDADSFATIARLPGLDVLHGQLVAMAASPITGLARGLGQMISGLAQQLNQIAEQGLVTGTDPEPAAEEPAAADSPAKETTAEEPAAADSPAEETATEEPAAGDSPADETASEEPAAEQPEPAANEGAAEPGGDSETESESSPAAPQADPEAPASAGATEDSEPETDPVAPDSEAQGDDPPGAAEDPAVDPGPGAPGSESQDAAGGDPDGPDSETKED